MKRHIKQLSVRKISYVALNALLAIAALMVVATAMANDSNEKGATPTPKGFDKYLVFVGNGLWRSVDGSPVVGGLNGDGMFFHKEIMKRTDAEIEEHRNQAIEFFAKRFGIDVLNSGGSILFTGFQGDPQNNLRAYTVSGEAVPARGWEVRDGGWAAFVVNPEGITLGGEFKGVHLPINSVVLFGNYNIKVERPNGKIEEIIINVETDQPLIFDNFGAGTVRCKLHSEQYGDGLAGGIMAPIFLDDNFLMQQDIRLILTFPGLGR